MKFVFLSSYILIVFLISIIYKRFDQDNKEALRKIVHIGIGPLIPLAKYLDLDQISALFFTGIVSLLTFINYKSKLFPTIEDVDRKSYGTIFYCLSLFILIYLYWNKDPTSLIAGFFIMTFGDGFAGLIGKNIQSKSWIIFNQKKSFFGTMTMFLTSLLVVFGLCSFQEYSLNINIFTIAFIATILEQLSFFGVDNFVVPILSAFCFNFFITGL
ncbi:Dolichol kinase [Prochlorococcus marinus str. MIT 9515]|uniref:Dolichol kinase n=1 Tax=Prochlorococcus marinus (strain MIT 9515) TaxID=167542 RepID=A2BZ85_PROM5|nr:dolichol kinase [Prochlorococcus marinus]ABM73096.1 Dolichol kinase [Prochlorococcus marinus str. MIT 9515]